MANQTHFEVHVLQAGRWSIHAQFSAGDKDLAIEEGKALSIQPGMDEVKVIREVFDSMEGTHRDFVIFKSSDMVSPSRKAKTSSDDGDLDDDDGDYGGFASYTSSDNGNWMDDDIDDESFSSDPWADKKPKRKKKKKNSFANKATTMTRLLVKLLIITLVSISLAALFTVLTSNVLSGTSIFGIRMEGNFESNVLFVVFVATFLLSAGSLATTQLRGTTLKSKEQATAEQTAALTQAQQVEAVAKAVEKTVTSQEAEAPQEDLNQAMEGIEEFQIDDEQKTAEGEATDERLKAAINGEDDENQDGFIEADQREAVETLSPNAEKQKKFMMDFLTTTLEGANADHKKLDNFNKFGVNLFLAGACETLATTRGMDEKSRAKVLADSVRVMGFKKSHAASFADKYEDYLLQDPRYMQMFQAGRNAMNTYFQDEDNASRHMQSSLEIWNKPKEKAEQAGPITVLFTDIAGSTAMTQTLGDKGAQKVIHAHNNLVRDALTDWNGKEVKHTGDGIMASFTKVTDSIEASIQMQRQTHIHNQHSPELPLHLKIGLNAGEPIAEDNDLFGTVVQMSARIVDKAQADEIFVSDIVRGICVGKEFKFINRGGYAMKGFDEDPTLYELVWREDEVAAAE